MLDNIEKLKQFSGFSREDHGNLEAQSTLCRCQGRQMIFQEGEKAQDMYVVLEGELQVFKKIGGKEVIIAMLKPGEVFGEMALLEDLPRSAAVRAKTECVLLSLSRQNLHCLRTEHIHTALKLMDVMTQGLCRRIREANKSLEIVKFWIT